ncbi:tRNA (adenine(58)-N(1))-methyltransferase non-catalytic subunit trm6, partial [Spiromyces aspiralis]
MDEDQQSGIVTCENGHEQQKQQQHATAAAVVGPNYLVLIRMPSGNEKFVTIEPGTTISLGKFGSFKSDHLIGKPLGSSFEIHGAALSPYLVPFTPATFDDATDETTNNNQYIFNDNHAQKLDSDQIEAMKQAGLSGSVTTEEIIESIKSNNEAFDKKTEYSKSKYLKRKENKFRKMFTVLEPTTFNITEHMFKKNPERIRYLRIDTLSQILTLANVCQSSKVLMIDETQGLILSSVLRIIQSPSGGGVVYALHDGQDPVLNMTKFFNFDHTVFGQLVTTLSIKYVGKPL